jgi:thiol:disulfide interchange protein DsbD
MPLPRFQSLRSTLYAASLILLLAALPPRSSAQSRPTVTAPHVTVSLLVPPAQIYPGQSFTAGLDFRMEDGWHVYWTNAGDSGEPPTANWMLPPGITASALQFPPPKRLPLGPLMDFGYEDEVVFPIPVQVAANFKPSGSPAALAAHVTWLVCREVCIPGKGDLHVERAALAAPPTSRQTDAAAQSLITKFQNQLPKPLPSTDTATFSPTPKGFVLDVIRW